MATAKYKIESGIQLLARLNKKIEIKNFYPNLFNSGLKHGNTVEISSDFNTSYSFLLIDIISEALFPSNEKEDPLGVLMFNTAGTFVYEHLIKTLLARIYTHLDTKGDSEVLKLDADRMLHKAMSNFFLLEIYDSTQFYTTIHNMDNVFMKHSNISLMIFDTLTAFYWSEQGFKITKMDVYIKNLLRIIQNVSKEYNIILIYTRPGYFNSSKDADNVKTSDITEGVSLKVELIDNGEGDYLANIKSSDKDYMKYYKIVDNIIKWQ